MIVASGILIVLVMMAGELAWSLRNERRLRARGAVAADDPVYASMRLAYPALFVLMGVEGVLTGPPSERVMVAGVAIFLAGKALKVWAIATLGERWTYTVFVLPGAPLVTGGPYRFVRHPNYAGVIGELVGTALFCGARVSGPLAIACFSWLLMRRIRSEEKALH